MSHTHAGTGPGSLGLVPRLTDERKKLSHVTLEIHARGHIISLLNVRYHLRDSGWIMAAKIAGLVHTVQLKLKIESCTSSQDEPTPRM
jgi:hypothetical protein